MRMKPGMRFLAPSVALVLAFSSLGSWACPLTPPAGLHGQTVSSELVINGLPTAIYQVRSIEPAERLIQDSAREWRNQGYMPRIRRLGPWRIVSAAGEGCLSVLQLKDEAGTQGFLSVSFPDRAVEALDDATRRLLPKETRIESVVRSKDLGRDGITIVVSASQGSDQWADDLLQRLGSEKWQDVEAQNLKQPAQQLEAEQILARQKGRQFTAVVWGGKQTQAVITVADAL